MSFNDRQFGERWNSLWNWAMVVKVKRLRTRSVETGEEPTIIDKDRTPVPTIRANNQGIRPQNLLLLYWATYVRVYFKEDKNPTEKHQQLQWFRVRLESDYLDCKKN